MNSRELIRHPGPESFDRIQSVLGNATRHSVRLCKGQNLLSAVAQLMDEVECDCGVMVLDGLDIGPFNYVVPSYSSDELHAAWYSDTHSCTAAHLNNATAIVGQRDGTCWLHCHALWDSDAGPGLGHLLPDAVTIASDTSVTLHAFDGGHFDVALDSETAFPIFHVQGQGQGQGSANAFIARIHPHEDIYTAVQQLISEAGFEQATILGIGSLIGARFEQGPSMQCPISEVLIATEASWNGSLVLPLHCVDTEKQLFHGNIDKGGGPVLVTFELMVVETGN